MPKSSRGSPSGPSIPHSMSSSTYDYSSCFSPKFKIMHFENRNIKLYTVLFVFSQMLNKTLLSLDLEPHIYCQQLPGTQFSDY